MLFTIRQVAKLSVLLILRDANLLAAKIEPGGKFFPFSEASP